MTHKKKIITDKETLGKIYISFFKNKNVFLKSKDINQNIEFIDYKDNKVLLRINDENYKLCRSLIYVRHNDEVIFSQLKPLSKKNDIHIYEPENIQIIKTPRKEERKIIDNSDNKNKLYITHVVSDFQIIETLSNNKKKTENIKWEISKKIENKYKFHKIFFINDKKNDSRIKYFHTKNITIFISNIDDDLNVKNKNDNIHYRNSIYTNDTYLQSEKLISEISVPILYKGMIIFGYIQINGKAELNNDDFSQIKKLGISTSELLSKDAVLIKMSDDRFAVTDLSMNGLGIIFKEKRKITHFIEDCQTFFNIFMPGNKQASILCRVKNINIIQNNVYRVGCEIINIDPIGEVYYSDYVEAL